MKHNHPQIFELLDIVTNKEDALKIINETKNHVQYESVIDTILKVGVEAQNMELINIAIYNGANIKAHSYLLRSAVELHNNDLFDFLLEKGADPFLDDGWVLSTASYHGNSYALKKLLELGVSPHSQEGGSMRDCAEYDQLDNVKLLAQYGGDLKIAAIGAAYGNNPHIIDYVIQTIGIEQIDVLKMIKIAIKEREIKTLVYLVENCNANLDLIIDKLGGNSKEKMEDFKLRQKEENIIKQEIKQTLTCKNKTKKI